MATVEMVMPKMGESIMEGTILSWLKKEGDLIEQDESVLEVATDKVDTEVPATHAGVLKKILAKEGEIIEVGKPIAIIEVKEDESDDPDPLPELDNPSVSDDKELLQDVPEYTSLILGKASYDDPANLEEKDFTPHWFKASLIRKMLAQENWQKFQGQPRVVG